MKEAPSPFAQSRALNWLFAAGLVAIPFDAIRGVSFLGELGNEASFPFFAAAIALAIWTTFTGAEARIVTSPTLKVALAILAVIGISLLANASDIVSIVFRERTGVNKFATTLLVVLYGLALAWTAEQLDEERIVPFLARFIGWSAAIASAYLLFELVGKHGLLGGAFGAIDHLIHSRQADIINVWDGSINQKVLYDWDPRLRSVSFEPPAFGNYTGFAWPWVWFAAVKSRPENRLRAWGLLALVTAAIVIAASRTGLLMLGSNVAMIGIVAILYDGRRADTEAAAAIRLLAPVVLLLVLGVVGLWTAGRYQEIVSGLMQGDSVSNISRFGFQMAAFQMFLSHPLFGVGLGQFGFHVVENLPSWIFRSPEIQPMITYPTAPWPNVYSIYGRIAAELGTFGLIGWVVLWLGLASRMASQVRRLAPMTVKRITLPYPIILNCIGVLVAGVASDTFRTPMIWIGLGLACGVLARAKTPNVTAASAPPQGLVPHRLTQ